MIYSKRLFILSILISLALMCSTYGCRQKPQNPYTEQEAKVILDRYMETMNKNDLVLVDEIIADEFVLHSPFFPEPIKGKEAYKALVTSTVNAFSEFKATIDEVVVKGDNIWGRFTMEGINTGPLGELPATNKKFRISGLAVSRVVGGNIVRDETFWNVLDFYQQLGFTLVPPQG